MYETLSQIAQTWGLVLFVIMARTGWPEVMDRAVLGWSLLLAAGEIWIVWSNDTPYTYAAGGDILLIFYFYAVIPNRLPLNHRCPHDPQGDSSQGPPDRDSYEPSRG